MWLLGRTGLGPGGAGGFRLQQARSGLWAHTPLVWGAPERAKATPRDRAGQPALGWGDPGSRPGAGGGGRAESAGLRGGRAAATGTDCGAATDPHSFPLASSDSAPPAPSPWPGHSHLEKREVCGEQAAWPGLAPRQRFGGCSRDACSRVPGTLGTRAEVAERGPQAQGEMDRAPGSGSQSPPGPRRWVSDVQPPSSC